MFHKDHECIFTFCMVTFCLHLFTCDNKVQYRFLNSYISAYDFYIENDIVEEMMSLTFFNVI